MKTRLMLLMLVLSSLLLAVQPASAQQTCQDFHLIVQARLYLPPAPIPFPYMPGWSGPFAGTLGGSMVAGFLSYAEPPNVDFPPPGLTDKGKVGKETNVIFKFDIAGMGSFQSVKDFGVFPNAPGQGMGNYSSTGQIDSTKGAGDFQGASGFFTIAGPAIAPVAFPPEMQNALGLWSPEVNGKICK